MRREGADMAREIQFLGVTIIPMGSRARRAVKAYPGHHTLALLPDGKVATRDPYLFKFAKPRRRFSIELAEGLHALGAISKAEYDKHRAEIEKANERNRQRRAADEIQNAAQRIGLKFDRSQRAMLRAAQR